jgi:hypothetical protein
MGITFISPLAGLVALAAILPLAAFAAGRRRVAVVRRVLGLRPAAGTGRFVAPAAAAGIVCLLAIAAAQPVRSERHTASVRSDADVYVVVDSSKSMAAAAGPRAATRFDRASGFALGLRRALPDVRVGLASLTDRVLPHLFPSSDVADFRATLEHALGIDRPPPLRKGRGTTTSLASLGSLGNAGYFPGATRKRVAVVLTDGESVPASAAQLSSRLHAGKVSLVFLQLWQPRERVFTPAGPDPRYAADPAAAASLQRLGAALGAPVFREGQEREVTARVQQLVGEGPRTKVSSHTTVRPLSPYVALMAILPLGLLLRRRNR